MKFTAILLLLPFFALSQSEPNSKMDHDTLNTQSGFKVYPKQMLKVGTGTMPDGDFKYIRISATSLFRYTGTDQAAVNSANSLSSNMRGMEYKVIRIDQYGNKKHGYIYYPIINVGATRYQIDIDNAIASGELEVPEEFRPKVKPITVEVKQQISVADELAKLKKLLDDGVLTKEEYEAQKKKLLEQ